MSEFPSADYNVEFNPASPKAAAAATGAKSGDLLMVPIDSLSVPEGLNVRVYNAAYEDRIEELCDSIMVNGFYRHMPLSGYPAKVGDKTLIYVTGGFTRLEAAKRAVKRGSVLQALPVVLHPPGTSMADLQVNLVTDNTNNPLTPYEKGIVVKRLSRLGFSEKQIAEKLILSQQHINRLLYLHSLPEAIQSMVANDRISARHAIDRTQEVGPEEALEEFNETLHTVSEDQVKIEEERGTAGRARPKAPRAAPTGPSKKVMFAAIDYAIALEDITFLIRWRKNEADAVAEVAATLKKPKAVKPPKAAGTRRRRTKAQIAAANIGQEHDGL